MIGESVRKAIDEQINRELYSAYLYQSMYSYCEARNFKGFARWLTVQAAEERMHAQKFIDHLHHRGVPVRFAAIAAPPRDFASIEDIFSQALSHEHELGEAIHALYDLAVEQHDYPAQVLLQWFVTEQVEEVAISSEILENVRMVGENSQGMFLLDREAAGRASLGSGSGDE